MKNSEVLFQKREGGSSITRVTEPGAGYREGSSLFDSLFYFKPDTNGTAYVIMIRPERYQYYDRWQITVTGTNYSFEQSGDDVDEYLHRVQLTGLVTNRTYTITMAWFEGDTPHDMSIKRTYYCANTSPSDHPYSDIYGTTTIPSYNAEYPNYCIQVKCPDNEEKMDGRCRYDAATRNLFWNVCASNSESHPVAGPMSPSRIVRWPPGPVYVSVTYKSTINQDVIEARINEWVSWMNGLVAFASVEFVLGSSTEDDARQINVIVGTHEQLWGYNPDDIAPGAETVVYGGYWETHYWNEGIVEARVKICCEDRYPFSWGDKPFEGIVFEELTEASGPGYDQFGLNNTIFSEIAYPGKTVGGPPGEDPTRDENVIRILYSLGYLKGEKASKHQESHFDSGITFTKSYRNYGILNTARAYELFFLINASEGCVTGDSGYSIPDELYLPYKSGRGYKLRAIYATEIPGDSGIEKNSGLSFRYTNPSAEGTPYFSLPGVPSFSTSTRVDGGYKFKVSGLNVDGEYYHISAYIKDATEQDIDDGSYYGFNWEKYTVSSVTLKTLARGRAYDFYLHSTYNGLESDWIYIGEGTVAPAVPVISDVSRTEGSITFTYTVSNSKFDTVYCTLYRGDTVVARYDSSLASETVTLNFDADNGNYVLKVHSAIWVNGTEVACVNNLGDRAYAEFSFSVADREYFYWATYTSEMKAGGNIASISHTVWNKFIDVLYSVVRMKNAENWNIYYANEYPYGSGFGLAAGETYATALLNYAKMSGDSEAERTLTAERFNIVNYVLSNLIYTGLSYKYSKVSKVRASELITLQDKLNLI